MEHHIFLPQQLFQLLEQGGVEQAPGPQPALGVGQIEHGGLLAGEEDKEVAYPGEQGIVAPGKAQIELPGEGSGSAGRFRDLAEGGDPVTHELGGFLVPDGDSALCQDGQVDLEVAAALLQHPGEDQQLQPVSSSRVT